MAGRAVTGLVVDGSTSAGAFELCVTLAVDEGETLAVLGPNGAGKTTLLRAISGLCPLEAGGIALDGQVLDDPAAGVWVAPETRSIGVVFQDLLLFPTADVADNVAFGLRAAGLSRRAARARADDWLERLGLGGRGSDRVGDLSGGEAQRVALARALAPEPRALLLDEPLSALDADVRATVRRDLRDHLRHHDGPRILVTHDPLDAAVLADRVVVLEHGAITADGQLADLVAHPRSTWAAELAGTNLLRGVATGRFLDLEEGGQLVAPEPPGDGAVLIAVRPSAVALHAEQPAGTPRNVWQGTVAEVEGFGERRRVRLDGSVPVVAEVTVDGLASLGLAAGGAVWASVKATDLRVYPA
jgi:molybdate transport system ATP-binding protein